MDAFEELSLEEQMRLSAACHEANAEAGACSPSIESLKRQAVDCERWADAYAALAAELADIKRERDDLMLSHCAERARIRELETALAEAQAQRDSWKRIAESGLGVTAETRAPAYERDPPHCPSCSCGLTVETPVQYVCACDVDECHKHKLRSNQYCHDDRQKAGLAQEPPDDAWLCVCGLTVKKRYTCMCGGREDNSRADRFAKETEGKHGT